MDSNKLENNILVSQITELIQINRRMYQLCELVLAHLSNYEDTKRFDNNLLDILGDISQFKFNA